MQKDRHSEDECACVILRTSVSEDACLPAGRKNLKIGKVYELSS